MSKSSDCRRGRTCVTDLHAHLVFVTKYRRNVLTKRVMVIVRASFLSVAKDLGFTVDAVNADHDHVHLLIRFPPKLSVSTMVNLLKGVSSRMIRHVAYPEVVNNLHGTHFWSPSYFAASCGGAPLSLVKQYIDQQGSEKAALNGRVLHRKTAHAHV
jgi:putative transposase